MQGFIALCAAVIFAQPKSSSLRHRSRLFDKHDRCGLAQNICSDGECRKKFAKHGQQKEKGNFLFRIITIVIYINSPYIIYMVSKNVIATISISSRIQEKNPLKSELIRTTFETVGGKLIEANENKLTGHLGTEGMYSHEADSIKEDFAYITKKMIVLYSQNNDIPVPNLHIEYTQ